MAILYECTDDQYWKIDAINSSALKTFINDPIEYQNRYIKKVLQFKQSDAMNFGSALHCKVLEPTEFDSRFIVKPDDVNLTTKAGKEWKESVCGRKIISNDDLKLIETLYTRAVDITPFEFQFGTHHKELVITKQHDKDNWLKVKVDWLIELPNKIINCDLKTIESIDDNSIIRAIKKYHYDKQTAFYDNVIFANFNKPVETYLLFMAKSTGNCRYLPVNNFVKHSRNFVLNKIDELIWCKNNNKFVSDYEISEIIIPDWF